MEQIAVARQEAYCFIILCIGHNVRTIFVCAVNMFSHFQCVAALLFIARTAFAWVTWIWAFLFAHISHRYSLFTLFTVFVNIEVARDNTKETGSVYYQILIWNRGTHLFLIDSNNFAVMTVPSFAFMRLIQNAFGLNYRPYWLVAVRIQYWLRYFAKSSIQKMYSHI